MSARTRRPRVLFVEDETSISEPFANALEREGFEAVVASTGREGLALADSVSPDLVLLDLRLPDCDGRTLCRKLRYRSETPIVMLTGRGSEADRIIGLDLGADDYVVKPFSSGEVIARIRAVLRRSRTTTGAPEAAMRVRDLELDPAARQVLLAGDEVTLTRKEFDLLERLMSDAGQVVTREDLMAAVWDENWFGSTKTLDVHIGWLRKKLGDHPAAPRYIHTIRGVGFRFAGPELCEAAESQE